MWLLADDSMDVLLHWFAQGKARQSKVFLSKPENRSSSSAFFTHTAWLLTVSPLTIIDLYRELGAQGLSEDESEDGSDPDETPKATKRRQPKVSSAKPVKKSAAAKQKAPALPANSEAGPSSGAGQRKGASPAREPVKAVSPGKFCTEIHALPFYDSSPLLLV